MLPFKRRKRASMADYIVFTNGNRKSLFGALLGLTVSLTVVPTVMAQSLKDIRAQQAEQKALENEVAFTNSICGGSISATINWSTVADWEDGESLAGACDDALGALEAICRGPGGKARGGKVSRFVCEGDGSGPSFSGSTLTFGAGPGVDGFAETKDYLDDAL